MNTKYLIVETTLGNNRRWIALMRSSKSSDVSIVLSYHMSKLSAQAAIKRYRAADQRRAENKGRVCRVD